MTDLSPPSSMLAAPTCATSCSRLTVEPFSESPPSPLASDLLEPLRPTALSAARFFLASDTMTGEESVS